MLDRLLARNFILSAATVIRVLSWSTTCGAQMVGPTPQPQGIPVTPEQAEEVQPENWAIHGQGTNVWLLQPDLQLVFHPGGYIAAPLPAPVGRPIPNALVIGLRSGITF